MSVLLPAPAAPRLRAQASWYSVAERVTGPLHTIFSCGLGAGEDRWHNEANVIKGSNLFSSGVGGEGLFSGSTLKWFQLFMYKLKP